MNKVELVGRLTRDVEIRTTESGTVTARFSIAVSRRFKNAEGVYEADFINCVAFGKTAEFIGKYFSKGSMIGVTGRIQTGNYTNKDCQKVYTTDVVIEECEFVTGKSDNNNTTKSEDPITPDFVDVPADTDEELPWN